MDRRLATALKRIIMRRHTLSTGDFNICCLETPAEIGEPFKAHLQKLVNTVPTYNHIILHTLFRTGTKPSVLDLVHTNKSHMIDVLAVGRPLGRRVHAFISFNFVCCAEYSSKNGDTVRTVTCYNRLDQLVSVTNWSLFDENTLEAALLVRLVCSGSKTVSFLSTSTRKWIFIPCAAWKRIEQLQHQKIWTNT